MSSGRCSPDHRSSSCCVRGRPARRPAHTFFVTARRRRCGSGRFSSGSRAIGGLQTRFDAGIGAVAVRRSRVHRRVLRMSICRRGGSAGAAPRAGRSTGASIAPAAMPPTPPAVVLTNGDSLDRWPRDDAFMPRLTDWSRAAPALVWIPTDRSPMTLPRPAGPGARAGTARSFNTLRVHRRAEGRDGQPRQSAAQLRTRAISR
jgi:hypothetical protein